MTVCQRHCRNVCIPFLVSRTTLGMSKPHILCSVSLSVSGIA
uniref:Uncharacterized protein n=1 Tax=Anguilla anguilla TaxID=7936 RepID=A0A0E9PWA0_ANGAN